MGKKNERPDSLGQNEAWALTAVLKLGPEQAYTVTIHRQMEELSRRSILSVGSIFNTLDRLEDKGLVTSHYEEVGGRMRKYYKVATRGTAALRRFADQGSVVAETLDLVES